MDFSHSDKVRDLQERLTPIHGQLMSIRPKPLFTRSWRRTAAPAIPGSSTKVIEDLKQQGQGGGSVESVPAALRTRRGPHQSRIRAAVRNHGTLAYRARGVQLLGARHRQHGSAGALCTPEQQQQRWLEPLLEGKIRSAFAMTEPDVASSDATNIQSSIVRDGDSYVINGRKWWTSGAGDPRCEILIFMGKTNPEAGRHSQQSMILVPMNTPGVKVLRTLTVFGYDHAPHGHAEIDFVERARAGGEHAARRGTRLRNRARAPGTGPHPPLHAPDRPRRTRAGNDVQARAEARRVRQARCRSRASRWSASPRRAS